MELTPLLQQPLQLLERLCDMLRVLVLDDRLWGLWGLFGPWHFPRQLNLLLLYCLLQLTYFPFTLIQLLNILLLLNQVLLVLHPHLLQIIFQKFDLLDKSVQLQLVTVVVLGVSLVDKLARGHA